ncbi:MAG: Lrp/AsnC family transcriptional regulator [Thermoanaerobaculaceae bacterium]
MKLDALDLKILASLQENGRMSLSAIAEKVGVAPATVHERLAKLRGAGVIQGFYTRINPAALGYTVTAFVHVRVDLAAGLEKIVEELAAIPEVEEVHLITGEFELIVKVRARDTVHLQELLLNRLHKVPGFVRSATEVCLTSPLERLGPLLRAE